MKKLALLFVAVLAVGVTSCSKDDDAGQAAVEGKWIISQEGTLVMGQEFLSDHEHSPNCPKDFVQISATTIVDHDFNGEECFEDIESKNYTRSGNTITITRDGEVDTATILQLTNTTLKVKSTYTAEGLSISSILVFTRA